MMNKVYQFYANASLEVYVEAISEEAAREKLEQDDVLHTEAMTLSCDFDDAILVSIEHSDKGIEDV